MAIEEKDGERWGETNVTPIRPEMAFVFDANTPIVDPRVQETIECRRYEKGLCRECDKPRGKFTPWCRIHFPWSPAEWTRKL